MNKLNLVLVLAIVILRISPVSSQDTKLISGSFSNEKVTVVIDQIASQAGHSLFFDANKIDSLYYTGSFDKVTLNDALKAVLNDFSISFFIHKEAIFITGDVNIVSQPIILQSTQNQEIKSVAKIERGLLFSREYQNQQQNPDDLENYVFEVGNRNQLVPGGKSTVAGYIRDRESNEPLFGAVIYTEGTFNAATTDESGFYSLKLPNGKNTLIAQYSGMRPTKRNIAVFSDGQLNVSMDVDVIALQEVTIVSDRDENVESPQMGLKRINVAEIENVPIVLGEKDILKVATTFAGIQTVGEGAAGFNVRGGKADQNLMLLDQGTIYNPTHFFGFFSVFNSDAIQNMDIYKSSIPASQGGRLSSVFDIQSKNANREKFSAYGGVSPITSKLTLEVPLFDKKAGLLVSGRSTYSNWVLRRVGDAEFRDNRVSFYDLMVSYDHDINDKNKIEVNAYISRDQFRLNSDTLFSFSDFGFSNATASAKWSSYVSDKIDLSVSAIYSAYEYELENDGSIPNAFKQGFGISEATLKSDLKYFLNEEHTLGAGLEVKRFSINPGTKDPLTAESLVIPQEIDQEQGVQTSIYVEDDYIFSDNLTLSAGLRYSIFSTFGEATVSEYQRGLPKQTDTRIGTTEFARGEHIKTYHGPELRLSARYKIDKESSVKAAYNRTRQYIHTLNNAASLSPTDTWTLSGEHLLPQIADQISLGYYRNLKSNMFETSIEVYYKDLQNLLDFKVGADFLLNENIETVTLQGPGKSYGVELSIKKSGKLNGWINYSFARSFLRLNGRSPEETVNGGAFFPTNYDIPNTVNLVANYKLTHRVGLSYNFTYRTGRPVTYPVGQYDFKGTQAVHYADRNSLRIPDYIRMDLGINLEAGHKLDKLAYSYWTLSVYNVLGRDNPFSVFFDVRDSQVNAFKLVVFSDPIPTITYNFKF